MRERGKSTRRTDERPAPVFFCLQKEPEVAEFPAEISKMQTKRHWDESQRRQIGADIPPLEIPLLQVFQNKSDKNQNAGGTSQRRRGSGNPGDQPAAATRIIKSNQSGGKKERFGVNRR